jgi:hypothetical protein
MAKELTAKQKFQIACITGEVQELIDAGAGIDALRARYGVTYHTVRAEREAEHFVFPVGRRGKNTKAEVGIVKPDVSTWTDAKMFALCKEWV